MTESLTTRSSKIEELARITDATTAATVSKVTTPKGERLEIAVSEVEKQIRLDAVALECLTWQDKEKFQSFTPQTERSSSSSDLVVSADSDPSVGTDLTQITNEFGHVEVRLLESESPERLLLDSPKLNFSIQLRATALKGVACQNDRVFTELLRENIE